MKKIKQLFEKYMYLCNKVQRYIYYKKNGTTSSQGWCMKDIKEWGDELVNAKKLI